MSGRNPLHHTSSQQPDETPVVLPHVVIIVTENSTLDVTVDGIAASAASACQDCSAAATASRS